MKKSNPNLPKLTENDREVLKKIIDTKKIPDSKIAEDMNLSPQAIFKIRKKLEQKGIVKGYVPVIDFEKIGINVVTLLIVRLSPKMWNSFSDEQISEKISNAPYVMGAYRVADDNASHVLLLAFRDTTQKEKYISELQTKFAEEVRINKIYTFSVNKIILHSQLGLLNEIVDKKNFSPQDLFLNHPSE